MRSARRPSVTARIWRTPATSTTPARTDRRPSSASTRRGTGRGTPGGGRYRGAGGGGNGTYYPLTFGARPGVLPFFVDQGSVVGSPAVTLTLSNEEAEPAGSGGTMGRAVEIRVGEGGGPG